TWQQPQQTSGSAIRQDVLCEVYRQTKTAAGPLAMSRNRVPDRPRHRRGEKGQSRSRGAGYKSLEESSCILLGWRAVFERVVQALIRLGSAAFYHAPSAVILDKSHRRGVLHACCIEHRSHLVQRSPFPLKLYVRGITALVNAGDSS